MNHRHWQASYGSIPNDIDPDAYRSVVDMMEQAMKRFAHRPAMRCAGQTLTYADLAATRHAKGAHGERRVPGAAARR